jgi:AcrR family transcriptional regulator
MEPPVTGTTESVARGSLRGGHAAMRKPKAPEQNRRRILKAAIEEFAARGFKGASMDAIASRTHTTRALINYYFGSKEKLYVEVLEHAYAEIREAEARLEIEHLTPIEAIRRIAQFTFHYYVEHEHFVQLVVAENQARGRHLGKSVSMQALNRPIVDRLALVLERGQREGAFRPDADPVEVHKAIAALGIFNMTNRHTFGAIFQREMGAKGDVDGRCRVAIDIVLSYLTNLAGPTEVSRPQP